MGENLNFLIAINGATLITVLTIGVKVLRIFNRIELKTDILWEDYENRTNGRTNRRH